MKKCDLSLIVAMLALILSKVSHGFTANLWAVVSVIWTVTFIGEWVLGKKCPGSEEMS